MHLFASPYLTEDHAMTRYVPFKPIKLWTGWLVSVVSILIGHERDISGEFTRGSLIYLFFLFLTFISKACGLVGWVIKKNKTT